MRFPCVVKPLALSASRGVMRANSVEELEAALVPLCRDLLIGPTSARCASPTHDEVIVEGFIEGREYALEGVLEQGALRVLAIFDKPDPLDGPFFEETIYVTPPPLPETRLRDAGRARSRTPRPPWGSHHGPIHAECRINEPASSCSRSPPRPIGGLVPAALRFAQRPQRERNASLGGAAAPSRDSASRSTATAARRARPA